MNVNSNGRKTSKFRPSAGKAGGCGKVGMVSTSSSSFDNYYIPGASVGAQSASVRRALKKRASNNLKGKSCC